MTKVEKRPVKAEDVLPVWALHPAGPVGFVRDAAGKAQRAQGGLFSVAKDTVYLGHFGLREAAEAQLRGTWGRTAVGELCTRARVAIRGKSVTLEQGIGQVLREQPGLSRRVVDQVMALREQELEALAAKRASDQDADPTVNPREALAQAVAKVKAEHPGLDDARARAMVYAADPELKKSVRRAVQGG